MKAIIGATAETGQVWIFEHSLGVLVPKFSFFTENLDAGSKQVIWIPCSTNRGKPAPLQGCHPGLSSKGITGGSAQLVKDGVDLIQCD